MKTFKPLKQTFLTTTIICLFWSVNLQAQNKLRITNATASGEYVNTLTRNVKQDAGFDIGIGLGDALAKDKTETYYETAYAYLAIDGNKNGNFSNKSVFHSTGESPWWQADLGSVHDISKIKIYNRTDSFKERLNNFYIMVSETPIRSNSTSRSQFGNGPMDGESKSMFQTTDNKRGRYVRIFIDDYEGILQLAEVEIYGYASQGDDVVNNFTPSTGGPNVSGVYGVVYDNINMANFSISAGSTSVILKMEEGSEADPETREYFNYNQLNGEYGWNNYERCYQRGANKIFCNNTGGVLVMRYQNGAQSFKFKPTAKNSSLDDLFGGGGANTQALWGQWNVEGKSVGVELMGGANSDLVIKLGSDLFEMNKISTSYPDKYEDDGGTATLTFVSNNKMKMAMNGQSIMLNRQGAPVTSSSPVNALFAGSSTTTTGGETGGVNQKNANGDTPLHIAIKKGESENMEEIIDLGANINLKNNQGKTPLDIAISKDDDAAIDLLLERNATISNETISNAVKKKDKSLLGTLLDGGASGSYALEQTVISGNIPMFKFMIDNHADVASVNNSHLDKAVNAKKYPMAKLLISNGVDADHALNVAINNNLSDLIYPAMNEGADADRALLYAVQKKDKDLAETAILDHNADANKGLTIAINNKDLQMVKMLLATQADPQIGMDTAIKLQYVDIIKALLDAGADGTDPEYIQSVATIGNNTLVKVLLDAGAEASDGIMAAVKANQATVTSTLIDFGADGSDDELLITSIYHNNAKLTQILMDEGADPDVGVVPAINSGAGNVLKLFIDAGSDISPVEYLRTAVNKSHISVVALLLANGHDANSGVDEVKGHTLLHTSVLNENVNLTNLLLNNGADITATTLDEEENTSLHLAVSKGRKHKDLAELLISKGADVNARNAKGELVYQVAKSRKMKRMLKKNDADKE